MTFPQQVEIDEAPTELFKLIQEKEWDLVVALCRHLPNEAKVWVIGRDEGSRNIDWSRLPLHEACINKPTHDVVDALLKAYPLSAQARDHSGKLPLHHACFHGASTEVVEKLLLTYPESINVEDDWDKTPLDVAQARSGANISEAQNRDSVVELIAKGPLYWYMIPQKKGWLKQEKEHLERLRNEFQQERDTYESQLGEKDTEIAQLKNEVQNFESDVAVLQESLKDQIDKRRSAEASVADLAENVAGTADTLRELEGKFERMSASADSLEKELRNKATNEQVLKGKLDSLTATLNDTLIDRAAFKEEAEATKSKLLFSEKNLEAVAASELSFRSKVELLSDKLIDVGEELAFDKISHIEETKDVKLENAVLRSQVAELKAVQATLEKKVEADSNALVSTTQSSSEYFLQSSERISDLDTSLAKATLQLSRNNEDHKEEKAKLESKISYLEDMVMVVVKKQQSSLDNFSIKNTCEYPVDTSVPV